MSYYYRRHIVCQHCGKEFHSKRYDAKYCPDSKCRKAASRSRSVTVTDITAPLSVTKGLGK